MPEVMKTVGRYEILREVGRGGMAMVYLARQTDLDRFVALKELGAFHASDPSFAQRFLRESRVAGSLSHPNIVTVHDYFEHDGTPYIAMEYVERGSLRPYVGRMNLAQIGGVLEGLLAGLTHGESNGIVHRDLKPENLMVTSDGRVKIADFGIAKATTKMQTGAFLTATGTTVGTPTYMAPEQAMAQDIGPWTDLYSVGCMAFELFTGNVPFHDSDAPMAILLRHVNEPIAPVKSIRPEVDERISDWIERMLVKEPTQRTQSAQDAWDDFEEIVLGLLGPRWRREARLVDRVEGATDGAKPLTPAPFQGTSAGAPGSEEFKSFAWGAPAADTGAQAAPPMWTPPPSESTPSIPEPVVGPPTPMPSQAVPAPAPPAPDPEPVIDGGFVTFGQPAPAPPTDALVPPAPPAPDEVLAATDIAPTPAPQPVAEVVTPEPVVEEPKAFETYVAPPPSRPPTSEPALTPPPVEAAPPAPEPVAPAPEPVAYTPEPAVPAPAPVADTMMPSSLPTSPPKPPKVKAPAGESGGRPKWIIPAAIVGGIAVIGVIGAVALGGGGGGEEAQPTPGGGAAKAAPAVTLASQGIGLKVPAGWSDSGEAPQIPGFADGAISAGGPKGGAVVFGKADDTAANSTLLAGDLRQAAGDLPEKTTVDIAGGAQAAKYAALPIGGDTKATVYAVPTDAGVATLACTADEATCDSIASSLEITEGDAFPVGPSESYQGDVEGILARLDKAEKTAASKLKSAERRTTQAAATSRLAVAYNGAAGALGKLDVSPADATLNANLAKSLKDVGTAYKNAAAEARGKDRAGYKRQGGRAVAAGKDVDTAVDGFAAAGYELNAANAAKVTTLPTLRTDPKPKAKKPATSSQSSQTQQSQPQQQQSQPQQQQQTQPQTQTQQPKPKPSKPTGGDDGVSGGGEG